MHQIVAIFLRDLRSFTVVPTGAIVGAIFAMFCGVVFVGQVFAPNSIATMQPVFDAATWLLIILCPAITMRLIAEERRVGTWELMLASPLNAFAIVKGKGTAAFSILVLLLMTTFPLVFVLELYADVDYGATFSGYLGLLLFGQSILASGLIVSACTKSQTVAYLVTTFFWLTFSLATKVLVNYVPAHFAEWVFLFDPDLRVGDFTIGLIDTANIVYFVVLIWGFGWMAMIAVNQTRQLRFSWLKLGSAICLLLISVISINMIALHEKARFRFDATGSRAYALSDQTQQMIDSLESKHRIVVLMDEGNASRASIKQIDEVLRRYDQSSDYIEVERVNPSDPASVDVYEQIVEDLLGVYKNEIIESEAAIAEGIEQFKQLQLFAASMSSVAETLHQASSSQEESSTLKTLTSSLTLLAQEGGLVLDAVQKAMLTNIESPLPRLGFARDILVAATSQWSKELAEVAWWLRSNRTQEIAEFCLRESIAFEKMARELQQADAMLRNLGELEFGLLAAQLQSGEGALLIGSEKALMIPSRILFPDRENTSITVSADVRFRGEQIISSAIRRLNSNIQPVVVFAHSEQGSLFGTRPNNADLFAAKSLLEASRFKVIEWMPHIESQPENLGDHIAWIIIPPSSRAGLEPTASELNLIAVAESLIAGGESVMINLQPSLLPKYGQADPWSHLTQQIGIQADTGQVILEQVAIAPNQFEVERSQTLHNTKSDHLVARALNGRATFMPLPIQVKGGNTIYAVEPSADRWFDNAWAQKAVSPRVDKLIEESIPIASTITMANKQRAMVVGSGGWMLSWAIDRAATLGGNNLVLLNPGNSEFLIASIEWLTGLDDWIAAGPLGQQSRRVSDLTQTGYITWSLILIFGVPLDFIGCALFVAWKRKAS